ncbi:MAG: hypothetical protein ACI84C_002121, partial [Flavobacteriales bacterium]
MRSLGLFAFIAITIALTSCEGETTYLKKVENNSNYPMWVYVGYNATSTNDSTYIDPHTSETIHVTTQRGGNSNSVPCLDAFESIRVGLQDSLVLIKSIEDEGNWTQEI